MCQEDKSYPLQVKLVKREMKKPLAGILGRWEVFPVRGEIFPVVGEILPVVGEIFPAPGEDMQA